MIERRSKLPYDHGDRSYVAESPSVTSSRMLCHGRHCLARLKSAVQDVWNSLDPAEKDGVRAWFWFTAVLGLLPLVGAALVWAVDGKSSNPTLHGDVYAIAAVVAYSGVGEALRNGRNSTRSVINRGFAALVIGLLNSLLFAIVSAASDPAGSLVYPTSVVLYLASTVAGLACVMDSRR